MKTPNHPQSSAALGVLCAIAAATVFSTGGVIVRRIDLPAWDVSFWRSVLLIATILPLLVWQRRVVMIDVRNAGLALFASAVALAGSMVAFILALGHAPVANVLIVFGATPFITALLARLFLGEALHRHTLAATAVAVVGLAISVASSLKAGAALGMAIAFIVVLCMSSNYVIVRHRRDVGMAPSLLLAGVISAVVALPFVQLGAVESRQMAWLLALGPGQLAGGLLLYIASLKRIPAGRAALLGLLELVLGPIWVWAIDGEKPADLTLVGGVIVIGSAAANVWLDSRTPAKAYSVRLEPAGRNMPVGRGARRNAFPIKWNGKRFHLIGARAKNRAMTQSSKGPLSGITVIDLSRILAGPYCTHLMAEMGARVIKVEQPKGGDDARAYGPFVKGRSTYFASVNRGKQSIALDLKGEGDRRIFEKLLAKADVIVENFRPGTMEKLGYGWAELHAKYPQLIYASASGFGHTGPNSRDPAYDMVVQGMGGIMSITGSVGGEPVRVGMSIGDIGAGLYTAVAVNAALVHRLKTGEATKIDIGMFDCQIALLENAVMRYTVEGEVPGPLGARHPTIVPFQSFKTEDGAIIISAGNDSLFIKMCNALGLPDMAKDPDYKTNALRQKHHGKLEAKIESLLKTRPTKHWLAVMAKADIPAGPINNVEQALHHPQVAARNMLVSVPDGSGGTLKLAGNPIKMSAFADSTTRPPAPDLDADRATILSYIGG